MHLQYHLHCSMFSNKVCRTHILSDSRQLWEISAIANGKIKNYIEKMLSRLHYRQKEKESAVVKLVSSFSGLTWLICFWHSWPKLISHSYGHGKRDRRWSPRGLKTMQARCVLLSLSLHGHIEHPLCTLPHDHDSHSVSRRPGGAELSHDICLTRCSVLWAPQVTVLFIKSHAVRPTWQSLKN